MPRPANRHIAQEILQAADEIVQAKGPDAFTIREVADKIGYSTATIYLYYKNRNELLEKLIAEGFEWLADVIDGASTSDDHVDNMRRGAHAYVDWALDHHRLYQLMFRTTRVDGVVDPETFAGGRRAWRAHHANIMGAVVSGQWPRIGDVDLATNLTWVEMHGLASLSISNRLWSGPLEPDEMKTRTRAFIDAMLAQWDQAWSAC